MSADRIDPRGAPLWRSHVLIHHNYGDRGMIEPHIVADFAGVARVMPNVSGKSAPRLFGGVLYSSITVTEIEP